MSKPSFTKKVITTDLVLPEHIRLTGLQRSILNSNANLERMRLHNYDNQSLVDSNFDPSKNILGLPDIVEAGEMIADAIARGLNIMMVSDYDCDGLTSASVSEIAFRDILKYPNYRTMVNQRAHGNGFNDTLVGRIIDVHKEWKVDLMLTSDHGSSDNHAYGVLKEAGISKIIVTDHHNIPKDNYPVNADILINPQRDDSTYYKYVSGCFVAFITMYQAYKSVHGSYSLPAFRKTLPYVAVSTISDVMSMDGPINRQVVKVGLAELNRYQDPVWRAIRSVLGIRNRVSQHDVGFKIAPLINTANRVGIEPEAFVALTSTDSKDALVRLELLQKQNLMRKTISKLVVKGQIKHLTDNPPDTVLALEIDTDLAINGIVANQLGERYYMPAFCFSMDKVTGNYFGSGRGVIPFIKLDKVLHAVHKADPSIFIKFGGHAGAAGCSLHAGKLEAFQDVMRTSIKSMYPDIPTDKPLEYLTELNPDTISPALAEEISAIGPYGKDWEEPVFKSTFKIGRIIMMGSLARLELITSTGSKFEAMHFFGKRSEITASNLKSMLNRGDSVIVCYKITLGSFRDNVVLNMEVVDLTRK